MKCRMQRSQNKIVRFFLIAAPRFHVGANKFKTVGLLAIDYRLEQLKMVHMFNIINVQVSEYLRTNVEMVHHQYHSIATILAYVIPRVKGSGQTSFLDKHMLLDQPAYQIKTR